MSTPSPSVRLSSGAVSTTGDVSASDPHHVDERWLTRVRGEYLEMPGLSLTQAQAQRLWGLERDACESLFAELLRSGFLRLTQQGGYVRGDVI